MKLRASLFFALLIFGPTISSAQKRKAKSAPPRPVRSSTIPPIQTPVPVPTKMFEPFEKADVKTMALQCVRMETEAGNIEIEFYPEFAPETVRNFLNLTAIGYFDTTTFNRIVPNFVVQGGAFSTRAEKPDGLYDRASRTIPDEPNQIKHERGVISMARADEPNSASCHFFFLVSDATGLDGKFTAFGRIIKGIEVVDEINKMPVDGDKPVKPVRLTKVAVYSCQKVEVR